MGVLATTVSVPAMTMLIVESGSDIEAGWTSQMLDFIVNTATDLMVNVKTGLPVLA
jgi:hypothetical protein